MAEKKTSKSIQDAPRFTKAQIIVSEKYASRKDLIGVLLEDGEEYTASQTDELIEKYLKGKVI